MYKRAGFWVEKTNDIEAFERHKSFLFLTAGSGNATSLVNVDRCICLCMSEVEESCITPRIQLRHLQRDNHALWWLQSRRCVQNRKLKTEGKSLGGRWLSVKVMLNSFYDKYARESAFTETPLQNSVLIRRHMCFFYLCECLLKLCSCNCLLKLI